MALNSPHTLQFAGFARYLSAALLGTLLLTAGCDSKAKPTEANFTQTINTYFTEHP